MLEQIYHHSLDTNAVILDAPGFDAAQFAQKRDAWRADGECPGPEEVGTLALSHEALDYLTSSLSDINKYSRVMYPVSNSIIDEDDAISTESALRAGLISPIDARSRQILRQLMEDFKDLVIQDYTAGSAPSTEFQDSFFRGEMSFGMYAFSDIPHIDTTASPYDTKNDIRYLTTVTGPTTSFYVGTDFGPEHFTDVGELDESKPVPGSISPHALPESTVVRFLEQGDPHSAPSIDTPVFRIFISGTLRPR